MTDLKEAVARVIDPDAWDCEHEAGALATCITQLDKTETATGYAMARELSLERVDTILAMPELRALLSPKAGEDVVERLFQISVKHGSAVSYWKELRTEIAAEVNALLRQPEAAPGWQPISEAKKDGRYVFFALKDIYSDKDKGGPKFKFGLSYFDQEKSEFMNTGWSSHWTPILVMNTPDGCVIRKAYALIQPNGGERE